MTSEARHFAAAGNRRYFKNLSNNQMLKTTARSIMQERSTRLSIDIPAKHQLHALMLICLRQFQPSKQVVVVKIHVAPANAVKIVGVHNFILQTRSRCPTSRLR